MDTETTQATEVRTSPSLGQMFVKTVVTATAGLIAQTLAEKGFDALTKLRHKDTTETTES